MDFSFVQILIVLVIALLVFGPKRLPELGKQVGRGLRDFKAQMSSISDDVRTMVDDDSERSDPSSAAAPAASSAGGAATVVESDDDLLDGVVVSGADGPASRPPAGE